MLQQMSEHARRKPTLGQFAIAKRLDKQEGIQAARKTFPICVFHDTRCDQGIKALRHYHRIWDAELKVFSNEPQHDWASHGSDAWRTVALTWKLEKEAQQEAPLEERIMKGNITGVTMGQLREQHFKARRQAREWAGAA